MLFLLLWVPEDRFNRFRPVLEETGNCGRSGFEDFSFGTHSRQRLRGDWSMYSDHSESWLSLFIKDQCANLVIVACFLLIPSLECLGMPRFVRCLKHLVLNDECSTKNMLARYNRHLTVTYGVEIRLRASE